MVSPAVAANITWTGQAGDGLWSNTNNWEGGVLPGAGDTAVFGNAASNTAHEIIVDDAYTLVRITIAGDDMRSFHFSKAGDGPGNGKPWMRYGATRRERF